MHQAFIENAENNENGKNRGHDQKRLCPQGLLVGQQGPGEEPMHSGWRT